jgi:endonuclease G, mitochondrial
MRLYFRTIILAAALAAPAVATADDAEIHTYHCLHGCPMGAAETNDLVVRPIYTLSSNDLTKFSDWVAYRVTRETIGSGADRRWQKDPWLADDETLAPADYTGASAALDVDRGHQAPLAALAGLGADDTNILSNITPQRKGLNQSSWMFLEGEERKLAQAGKTVYVVTGPLYEREMRPLPQTRKEHRVPSGYWKVIAVEDGRTTRISSFIFEQETPRGAKYCDMRKPLDDVESRAKLRLFPRLQRRSFGSLDRDIGCAS